MNGTVKCCVLPSDSETSVPEIGQKDLTAGVGKELLVVNDHGERQARLFAPVAEFVRE